MIVEYALILMLHTGPFHLATFTGENAMGACVTNGQSITGQNRAERRLRTKRLVEPTYPGFIRAHCQAIYR